MVEKTENKSENCMSFTINNIIREIDYHLTDQGEIRISLENIQHRITLPGLIHEVF